MDGISSHVAHHAENGVISGRCTPDQRRTERNKGNTVTSCTSSYVLLYELRIRARVTRLAKFTIDLSVVEPEVAERDAILSQKAAVHALCKYGKRFGGGGGRGVDAFHVCVLAKVQRVVIERAIISINFKGN